MSSRQTSPIRSAGRKPPVAAADAALARAARAAARRAHAPYSGFRVGAALRDAKGRLFEGGNIENAAYPLGVCAERTALLCWRAAKGAAVRLLVIHTDTAEPTTPCGLCRDALLRWAPCAEVFLSCRAGIAGPFRAEEWLPGRAGAANGDPDRALLRPPGMRARLQRAKPA